MRALPSETITIDEMDRDARDVVKLWLPKGSADNIGANVGPAQEPGTAPAIPPGLENRPKASSRMTCVGESGEPSSMLPAQLRSAQFVPMVVRFVYRGTAASVAWPTWKLSGFVLNPTLIGGPLLPKAIAPSGLPEVGAPCPVDADWILDSAFEPIDGENVPPPPVEPEPWDWSSRLGIPDLGQLAKGLGEGVEKAASKVALGIGLALGAAVLVVALK
jgi:hypothetical protein